jgi:hypothetical protein
MAVCLQTASHPVWHSLLVHGPLAEGYTQRSESMMPGCDYRWGRSRPSKPRLEPYFLDEQAFVSVESTIS